jgi:hypothetical protein
MGRLTFQCFGLPYYVDAEYELAWSWILSRSATVTKAGMGARILWETP